MTDLPENPDSHSPAEEVIVSYDQIVSDFDGSFAESHEETMTLNDLAYDLDDFFMREHIDLTTMKVKFKNGSIAVPKIVLTSK